jgi:hypothetical protein
MTCFSAVSLSLGLIDLWRGVEPPWWRLPTIGFVAVTLGWLIFGIAWTVTAAILPRRRSG